MLLDKNGNVKNYKSMVMKSADLCTTHSSALNRVLHQPWCCDDSLRARKELWSDVCLSSLHLHCSLERRG